jgi:ADP-ribose pyrophosphatase
MKLEKIEKHTDTKYLNFYTAKYVGEKNIDYHFASRRKDDSLQKADICDAVRILPYIKETDEIVFIKNFRYTLNTYVYELPAGLVEPDEDRLAAAKRELAEETGATVLTIEKVLDCSFTSAGMSDETIQMYVAQVSMSGNQQLDETEDIEIVKVKVSQLDQFLSTHTMCTGSALLAKYFVATLK